MPYLNLDDGYPDHPKVEGLSDGAYRLHGAVLFYVARYRLDGYVTTQQLRARTKWNDKHQSELVAAGLLHQAGQACPRDHGPDVCPPDDTTSWRLHDYFQWNKSREWWDRKRSGNAQRQAEWRKSQDELRERRERA